MTTNQTHIFGKLTEWVKMCQFSGASPSYRFLGCVLGVVFVAASFLMIWLGAGPITGPWDVVSLLNACWRISNGQIPHIDFHNPIGPFTYLPIVAGMKITGPSTSAIAYGSVVIVLVLIPWAWGIASSRLQPFGAFIFSLFCGFLLISPRPLGFAIRDTTYAMIYNREGYVLLSMFLLGHFLLTRKSEGDRSMLSGLSIGFLFGLIFYCKITYFAAALGSALLGIMLSRRSGLWFVGASGGTLAACALFYLCVHVSPVAYLKDVITAGQSQLPAMRLHLLEEAVVTNSVLIYLTAVMLCLCTYVNYSSYKPARFSVRLWLVAVWIIGIALFIDGGNAAQGRGGDDPLFFVAGMIVFELFRRQNCEQMDIRKSGARLLYIGTTLIGLPLFCGSILVADIASFSYSAVWNLVRRPSFDVSRRIDSKPLGDLLVPASAQRLSSYWPANQFPLRINEGIGLLRKHLSEKDKVTTFGFTDPFSFACGLQPPSGGDQWWDINMDFSLSRHPSPEQFLGEVSLVMIPRRVPGIQGWNFDTDDAMLQIYGNYLQNNFVQIDSSESWTLYRRRLLSIN